MSEQGGRAARGFWGETAGEGVLERYRTLINTIDDGIYQLDADGQFVAVNDVIVDRLGYSRDDLIGAHVSTVLDDTDVERIERAIRQLLQTPDEDVVTMEVPVETEAGEQVFFELRVNLLEADGELTGTIGVAREVTNRRRRERQLKRERNQTEKLLETAPVAVAVSDSDGETIRANQRAQGFLGLSEAELVEGPENEDEWTTYDADGNELTEDELPEARVLETGEPVYDEEIAIEDPGGDRMWFRLNSAPVFDEDGDLDRIITTGEDVTELKNRERQLERRKNELETELGEILGRVSDGFFAVNEDWEFTHVNERAQDLINPDGTDLIGTNIWETFPESSEGAFREHYERALTEQVTVSFEEYYPEPLDTWFEVRAYPSETGLSVYFRDVTDRKEREHQLEQYETIVETINDGIYVVDTDGRFAMVNDAYTDLTGYSRDDLIGEHVSLVVEDEVRAQATELESAMRKDDADLQVLDATVETASGESMAVEATFALFDGPADDERRIGVVRDITGRKERERELAKYETIVETMNDGIYVKGEDGRFTMVNDAYAEMVGYDREELVGAHASLVVDEAAIEQSRDRLNSSSGPNSTVEAHLETADGDTVPAEGTFATVDADGERQEVGVVRDITERREYERRIEESEERYRTLVENFPNGAVGLFDENLAYTAVGGELLDGLDLEPEDRIGKTLHELHDDRLANELEPHFQAVIDGDTATFEAELNGRQLQATALPIGGRSNDARGMILVQDVTEQRETQRELEESEARFRMLAENLEEIAWMAGPDGEEFLYLNPAYEDVWGREREELYDDPSAFLEYVHPEDRDRVASAFDALPDEALDEEYRIVRPDGEVRWVHAHGNRTHDPDIEMTRVIGIGQDVTERKEREYELERALDLLERTERVADVGGWEIDTETQDVFWTDYTFELLGVDADEEPPLESALDMYHDEDQPTVEAAVEDALASGDPFDVEARVHTTDGDIRWLRLQGVPELADGEVVSVRGAAQNITERKERERAIEESERRYRTLAEHIPGGAVGVYDHDLEYTLTEGAALGDKLPGSDVLEGSRLPEIFPADTVEDLEPAFRTAIEDGVTKSTMTEFDGLHWQVWAAPLRDGDGEIFAGLSFAQDVTEQVEREAELEASNERLEQFAYAASHDLQEPLRMVSSYLSLIKRRYEDVLDDDGREFLDYAVDGSERMREMIDALLKYSRVDTRGDPFEPVDLDSVVESVLADYQVRIRETNADVTTTDLPTVYGDADQLRQVFGNLLNNALEYSGDEPPTVRVFAEREGDHWVVGVEDEGIGIDAEHEERVFEVFQRLHTQEEHGGTGIGLALAQRIVERHEGDIWVESVPGEGSTFYCSLPVVEESND